MEAPKSPGSGTKKEKKSYVVDNLDKLEDLFLKLANVTKQLRTAVEGDEFQIQILKTKVYDLDRQKRETANRVEIQEKKLEETMEIMESLDKKLKIFNGEQDLSTIPISELEELSSSLTKSYQTIAFSQALATLKKGRRASDVVYSFGAPSVKEYGHSHHAVSHRKKTSLKVMPPKAAQKPQVSLELQKLEEFAQLFSQLDISSMKSKILEMEDEYKGIIEQGATLAQELTELKENLTKTENELLETENLRLQKEKALKQMTGEADLSLLSTPKLNELSSKISNLQKQVAMAQAFTEIQRTSPFYSDPTDANCVVCFERPRDVILIPCKHTFCKMCSDVVRICPTCRKRIQERQPLETA